MQIHFDQTMKHWVTSSCNETHVHLFDSLYFGRISDGFAKQLTKVYSHLKTVQVMKVQQQQGAVDCGLFAIAYAVYLAKDINSSGLHKTNSEGILRLPSQEQT